jgi:hypothetical protein
MSDLSLVKIRIKEGVWEGILTNEGAVSEVPQIVVTHLEKTLNGVTLLDQVDTPGAWILRVEIPSGLISDGVHTFLIHDKATGHTLSSFSIVAGEPLSQDIRAEVNLLRAELDMLKKAFRRHCVETAN